MALSFSGALLVGTGASHSELIFVNEPGWYAETSHGLLDGSHHCLRPAQKDLATGNVGHQLPKVRGGKKVGVSRLLSISDDVVDGDAAATCQAVQLLTEDDVLLACRTVDQREVAVHSFQQGTDRRDAHSPGDQHNPFSGARVFRE